MMKKISGILCFGLFFLIGSPLDSWASTIIRSFSAYELHIAARRNMIQPYSYNYELNDGVILTPLNTSLRSARTFGLRTRLSFATITLNFYSPKNIIGYSLYIFSSYRNYEVIRFEHPNQWHSLTANNPPAGNTVISEFGSHQFTRFGYCNLIGVALNNQDQSLGRLIIRTPLYNTFAFVFYTYREDDVP